MRLPKDVTEALTKQEKSVKKSPGGKAKRRVAQKRMARADMTAETTTEVDDSTKTQIGTREKARKKKSKKK